MKKVLGILLTLFFSGYVHAADIEKCPPAFDAENQRREALYPAPDGLPALFFHDQEVINWPETSELLQVLQPSTQKRRLILKVASATKRSAEAIGIGAIMLGVYLANTLPSEVTIFEDDICTWNGLLP